MMWKRAALLSLAGLAAGMLIGVCIMLARDMTLQEALPGILAGGIYSAAAMGSTIVYGIEKWSIARATVTHFLFVFLLYALLAVFLGWFRPGDPVFWIVLAAMAAVYVLIWLLQYLSYRRKIQEMNDSLKKWKAGEKAE